MQKKCKVSCEQKTSRKDGSDMKSKISNLMGSVLSGSSINFTFFNGCVFNCYCFLPVSPIFDGLD